MFRSMVPCKRLCFVGALVGTVPSCSMLLHSCAHNLTNNKQLTTFFIENKIAVHTNVVLRSLVDNYGTFCSKRSFTWLNNAGRLKSNDWHWGKRYFHEKQDPSDRKENKICRLSNQNILDIIKSKQTLIKPSMINQLIGKSSLKKCSEIFQDKVVHQNIIGSAKHMVPKLNPVTLHNLFYPMLLRMMQKDSPHDRLVRLWEQKIQKINIDEDCHIAYHALQSSLKDYCNSPQRNLENITTLAKISLYRLFDREFFPQTVLSQTQYHLLHTLAMKNYYVGNKFWPFAYSCFCSNHFDWLNDSKLRDVFRTVVQYEKKFNQEGYLTFLHGQTRSVGFLLYLYSKLWSLCNGRLPDNYLFPFIKNRDGFDLTQESNMRERLVHGEYIKDNSVEHYLTKSLLFTNYALFSVLDAPYDNSGTFFKNNNFVYGCDLKLEDIFSMINLHDCYQKYKNEFDNLSHEYAELDNYGNLLMIAIPKKMAESVAYSASINGTNRPIKLVSENTATVSSNKIIEVLCTKEPQVQEPLLIDGIEFCIPMTHDCVLNPRCGIKVVFIEATNQKKLGDFNRKFDDLVVRIRNNTRYGSK